GRYRYRRQPGLIERQWRTWRGEGSAFSEIASRLRDGRTRVSRPILLNGGGVVRKGSPMAFPASISQPASISRIVGFAIPALLLAGCGLSGPAHDAASPDIPSVTMGFASYDPT